MRETFKTGKPIKAAAVLAVCAALLGGCGAAKTAAPKYTTADVDKALVKADNAFAMRLAEPLLSEAAEKHANTVFSPLSVSFALSLLLNGAEGETRAELLSLLAAEGMTPESLNAGNEVLLDLLQHADPAVEVRIANAVWSKKEVRLNAAYKKRLQHFYAADAASLDFGKPDAAKTINRWASKQTGGHIDGLVDGADLRELDLLLANAVYFNGSWQQPFSASSTSGQPFRLDGGAEVQVPMMYQRESLAHKETKLFKAVRLPYGGGQWGMIVVLPQPGASLKQAEEAFLGSPASWSDGFTEGATVLHLPKFTFKKRAIMNDLLKNLGMHRAFDPSRADFSGMEEDADKRLYVSRVLHKAFIAVDELGTEAAAVTEADAAGSSGPPPESFEFRADRPFFFAIADRTTGTLAFLGAVADPTSTSGDD